MDGMNDHVIRFNKPSLEGNELAYIQTAGLAPSTSSASAQCRLRGAPVPPRPTTVPDGARH